MQFLFYSGGTVREPTVQRTDGGKKAAFLCLVAEILPQIPQLFRQFLKFIVPRSVDYFLVGKFSFLKQTRHLRRHSSPGKKGRAGGTSRPALCDPQPFFVKPQRIFLSTDQQALTALTKFLFQKGRCIEASRVLLKKGNYPFQAAGTVSAAGQSTANNRLRHRLQRTGNRHGLRVFWALFPFLGPCDSLHLFFRGGKEAELLVGRLGGQKNSGFFARCLDSLIYL